MLLWVVVAFMSCHKDEAMNAPAKEGDPIKLTLTFNTTENIVISRAVSSDTEEKRLHNLYVFVFNPDGSVAYRSFFDDVNKVGTHTMTLQDVPSGSGKTICVLANINNSLMCTTSDALDAITSKDELDQAACNLNQAIIERGSQFMMSGCVATDLIPGQTTSITVPLKRLDAKIRFKVVSGTQAAGNDYDVTFTPKNWRVVQAPKRVSIFPQSDADLFTNLTEDFFASGWNAYEGSGNDYGKEFAFYMLENKVSPRQLIPAIGTPAEQYANRERQEKNPIDGSDKVSNGAFIYAPATGTYVELTGVVSYALNANQDISADVKYVVHLGYVDGNPNDYSTNRNSEYIYTVTVNSVDNIIVEVEQIGEEPQPGAEGAVTIANTIMNFDAHYSTFTVNFAWQSVDQELTWNVSTPFSTLSEETTAKDYQWVLFRINKKNAGRTAYVSNLRPYPGDTYKYQGEISLDSYLSDWNAGTDRLLDVAQLVSLLKESKSRQTSSGSATLPNLFDSGNNIIVTVFLNEYYYNTDPINPGNPLPTTYPNDFWKRFVNEPQRVMNILSRLMTSQDQQSTKATALYSFRQASIQTIYNRDLAGVFTGWGTQQVQDDTKYQFDAARAVSTTYQTYTDYYNGRQNFLRMIYHIAATPSWSTFVNAPFGATATTPAVTAVNMTSGYNYAKWNCLRRNRDNNGNGTIDVDEVRWYLASIDQLRGIWVGEPALNSDARLYKYSDWSSANQLNQWYGSSTVPSRSGTNSSTYDNSQVLWSSEGASDGSLSAITGGYSTANVKYRCVRNLGLNDASSSGSRQNIAVTAPDMYATYNSSTREIDLTRMNPQTIRGYTQLTDLPAHHERSADNKPWWNFQIATSTTGSSYTWVSGNTAINSGTRICPSGWRAPNQRELVLMLALVKNSGWTQTNSFSRTSFSFNPGTRYGFAVSASGSTATMLYMINTGSETGGFRCVRDVNP